MVHYGLLEHFRHDSEWHYCLSSLFEANQAQLGKFQVMIHPGTLFWSLVSNAINPEPVVESELIQPDLNGRIKCFPEHP